MNEVSVSDIIYTAKRYFFNGGSILQCNLVSG